MGFFPVMAGSIAWRDALQRRGGALGENLSARYRGREPDKHGIFLFARGALRRELNFVNQ